MIKELVLSTLAEINKDIIDDDRVGRFDIKELLMTDEKGIRLALRVTIHKGNGIKEEVTTEYKPKKIEELESGVEAIYSDVLVEMLKLLL